MGQPAGDSVILGRVTGAFGVRGWVKILSYTDPRENIFHYGSWRMRIGEGWQTFELEQGRSQGRGLVAKLDTVDDRDAALRLMGTAISVSADRLPELPDGKFYWAQLLGLSVVDLQGQEFGRVTALMETGANDVLVLGGARERLVPFIWGSVIKRVDLAQGLIEADWQPDN